MEEARDGFVTALEAELAVARKNDIVFDYLPIQRLSKGPNGVYLGMLEGETQLLEGSIVRIEVQHGQDARAEVVAVEDFELVIATDMELELETYYRIKYNLAWLLEALLDWILEIDTRLPRAIAQGLVLSGHYFATPDSSLRPRVSQNLNEYQMEAVVHGLNSELTFVWGPPGTGKSRTIAELIVQYLIAGKSVLFVSQSNLAVDIVAKQVVENKNKAIQRLKENHRLLRSGYPKMQPLEQWSDVLPYVIALSKSPFLAAALEQLQAQRKELFRQSRQGTDVASQLKDNWRNFEVVRSLVRHEVAELEERASFIATTVAKTSVTEAIKTRKFDAVVVDEASMMSVPSVFAALTLAKQHGVVAGDFYQLQPIQVSSHAKAKRWLGQSVFTSSGIRDAVMTGKYDDPRLVILKRQYRMAEVISGIANAMFYGGVLEDAEAEMRSLLPVEELLGENRLILIDVSDCGAECRTDPDTFSRTNHGLAQISNSLARLYLDKNIPVGIITPYRAQARKKNGYFTKDELRGQVQVSTVHKFRGSEKDVIIFEVADSYPSKPSKLISGSKETFLDPYKTSPTLPLINVALTRAKSQVILVVDFKYLRNYLSNTNILKQVIDHFLSKGVVITLRTGEVRVPNKGEEVRPKRVVRRAEKETASGFDQQRAREFLQCTCGGSFVVRENRSGGYFLGCSRYPHCKKTQPLDDNNLLSIVASLQPKCPKCSEILTGTVQKRWPFLHCVVCGCQLSKQEVRGILLQYR